MRQLRTGTSGVALPGASDIIETGGEREVLMEISSLITPEVYEVIFRMGHMDELVIADANYSASALSERSCRPG